MTIRPVSAIQISACALSAAVTADEGCAIWLMTR
jgi:hypothetical protein